MATKSDSYKPEVWRHIDKRSDCVYLDASEPCWGQVKYYDWIDEYGYCDDAYACDGHASLCRAQVPAFAVQDLLVPRFVVGGKYVPAPTEPKGEKNSKKE